MLLNLAFPGFLPRVDTWQKRMLSFESGSRQENYQAEMAKRAVANGFLFGKGPGKGHVKNDLYSAQSDFIYASSIEEFGSLNNYVWKFVNYKPIVNTWNSKNEVPATTIISDSMSKDLKKRGFKFVGSTICYAFMQATGMVNDHTIDCFRYKECI